jgi:hypothetical protein
VRTKKTNFTAEAQRAQRNTAEHAEGTEKNKPLQKAKTISPQRHGGHRERLTVIKSKDLLTAQHAEGTEENIVVPPVRGGVR